MILRLHTTCFFFGQRGLQGSEWKTKQLNGSERQETLLSVMTWNVQWCRNMWYGETPKSDKKEIPSNWHLLDGNKCFIGSKNFKRDEDGEIRKTLSKGAWQEVWLLHRIESLLGMKNSPVKLAGRFYYHHFAYKETMAHKVWALAAVPEL